MISVADAKHILADNLWKLPSESLPLSDATGRVISTEVTSPIDVPSFNNSAMDGYAFCFDEQITKFTVTETIQAGDGAAHSINSGEAARIFTGAPMPDGANTVIQQV